MERKRIESFLSEIDEDLVAYAPFLRELGFTSNQSIKYLKDKDLQSVGIVIPPGHKCLLKNAVAKLQTHKSKLGLTPDLSETETSVARTRGTLKRLKLFGLEEIVGESAQSCSSLSARESSVFSRYNKIEVFTEDHDDTDNEHSSFLFESKQDHVSQSGSR